MQTRAILQDKARDRRIEFSFSENGLNIDCFNNDDNEAIFGMDIANAELGDFSKWLEEKGGYHAN